MYFNLVIIAVVCVFITISEGKSKDSYEHKIREVILKDYDKVVRPEVKGNARTPIVIEFGFKLKKLAKVSVKEETITVDTWITMRWFNTFISWDEKKYGKTDKINFLPTEIWFPDISLINNADSRVHRAGGPKFFASQVVVTNKGENVWTGPATFTASCAMTLNSWPFDDQQCNLTFGSVTYGSNLLKIKKFAGKGANKEDNIPADSGNWYINNNVQPVLTETSFGSCCKFDFSQITYTIDMGRRFEYHLFYMVAPCLALASLTLVSFWIPSESGERIGFVTTLLLGMMVFLLIVPDSLPESSQSIPVLGTLMMSTMIMIGFALLATIVILRCYHATGNPPRCLQFLIKPSKMKRTVPSESFANPKTPGTSIKLEDVMPDESVNEQPTFDKLIVEEDNRWYSISEKLNRIFFWLFFFVVVLMYGCTLGVSMANTKIV